jgi:NodT family efflux transporter outer membrane factor (OMF) lipoprotein
MNRRNQTLLGLAPAALLLGGCAVRSSREAPPPALPESYAAAGDLGAAADPRILAQWWKDFGDPLLDSLIERTVSGNLDLRIAEERVREARATRGYTAATRRSPNAGVSGGYSDRSGGRQEFTSSGTGLYNTGFDASYELDLFGGARASVRAAEADARATEEGMRHVLVTAVAETARNYMELRESQERLEVARKTLATQEEALRLTELRRKAGLTSDFDTTRAKAQVESMRAGIPTLEAQVQRSINAIALLIGEQPSKVQTDLAEMRPMPVTPPAVPVGLPSDLLRRRPDVREAESNIAGSAARVGVAVSNLYPKFSLTSSAGGQSGILTQILSGAARIWAFGTSFSWGILNYSATKANIQAAESREQQAVMAYEKTVLTALTDVENALSAYTNEKERQPALEQALAAQRKALDLANIRYKNGLSNFLEVLDAQRSLYSGEDALTQSRAGVNTNLVALYKALGGGW